MAQAIHACEKVEDEKSGGTTLHRKGEKTSPGSRRCLRPRASGGGKKRDHNLIVKRKRGNQRSVFPVPINARRNGKFGMSR
jgi:hypothetical protein